VESFGPLTPQTLKAFHRISAAIIDRLFWPSGSNIKNEAPPPSQEPYFENTSASKPTNRTNPTPAPSKPIPSLIVDNPFLACSLIPFTVWISPPAGLNIESSEEKEEVTSCNKSKISKDPYLSPCLASIVTKDPSFSIITSSDIF
jgi:hypothetical protein